MKRAAAISAALMLAACAPGGEAKPARPDFRPALEAHLAALSARDLEAFKATLTTGDDMRVVFPNGSVVDTTDGVVSFHEEWFKDPDWRWDGEIVDIIEGEDLAVAFMKYDYRDTPEDEPRSSWLALVFALEDGAWRLVHDQNTRIEE